MPTIEGVVTIVQESRFQLTDDRGAAHLFILGHHALAESDQLEPLARHQTRVRVTYRETEGLIGFVAHGLATL